MPSITVTEFERRLHAISTCQPVGLTTVAPPTMRKRKNPFADLIVKVTEVNGFINWTYGKTVNRQRKREGRKEDFKARQRQWGIRIKHSPLVSHVPADGETRMYLEMKVERRKWRFIHTADLIEIPEADLKPWLPPIRKSRQDVDRDVILRDYRLDHIAEIRIGGETWSVRPLCRRLQTYQDAIAQARESQTTLEAAI